MNLPSNLSHALKVHWQDYSFLVVEIGYATLKAKDVDSSITWLLNLPTPPAISLAPSFPNIPFATANNFGFFLFSS